MTEHQIWGCFFPNFAFKGFLNKFCKQEIRCTVLNLNQTERVKSLKKRPERPQMRWQLAKQNKFSSFS